MNFIQHLYRPIELLKNDDFKCGAFAAIKCNVAFYAFLLGIFMVMMGRLPSIKQWESMVLSYVLMASLHGIYWLNISIGKKASNRVEVGFNLENLGFVTMLFILIVMNITLLRCILDTSLKIVKFY